MNNLSLLELFWSISSRLWWWNSKNRIFWYSMSVAQSFGKPCLAHQNTDTVVACIQVYNIFPPKTFTAVARPLHPTNESKEVPQIQELNSLKVTCDGFGESYSCSVRIQRPNGDVFDRQSVIKQFGDWTIVWGPCLSSWVSVHNFSTQSCQQEYLVDFENTLLNSVSIISIYQLFWTRVGEIELDADKASDRTVGAQWWQWIGFERGRRKKLHVYALWYASVKGTIFSKIISLKLRSGSFVHSTPEVKNMF